MFHSRDHFLSDVAALRKANATQDVHIYVMGKNIGVIEIDAAERNAEIDPPAIVRAEIGRSQARCICGREDRSKAKIDDARLIKYGMR